MSVTTRVVREKKGRRRRRRSRSQVVVRTISTRRSRGRRRRQRSRKGRSRSQPSNPYLKSLMNPERFLSKIPDVNNYDSATFQVIIDGTIGTASDGSVAMGFYPCPIQSGTTNTAPVIIGTAIASGGQGNWTTQAQTQSPSSSTIIGAFSMYRAVSGVLELEFVGGTSNDFGQICAYPLFRGESAATTFANAITNQLSSAGPLRNGIRMLWKPMDIADLQYQPCLASACTTLFGAAANTAPVTTGTTTASLGTDQPYVALMAYVTGAQASTNVLRYRWIVNYEGTPERSGLNLFSTEPSVGNSSWIDSAFSVVRQLPWADVWQPVAGIVGEAIRENLSSQISTIGGLAIGAAGSALQRSRARASRLPISYEYAID